MKRIIMIKGAVETLEFFSQQMAKTFQQQQWEVWFWDLKTPLASREQFEQMDDLQDSVLITFNFIGLSGEAQFACAQNSRGTVSLWDQYGVRCICIMVDHPMYYAKQLMQRQGNRTLCCVDLDHCHFVEQFYPQYGKVQFLPLAGTQLEPMDGQNGSRSDERPIEVLFAGNYVALSDLLPHTAGMDAESRDYYFAIAEELIAHPDRSIESVILEHLQSDFPEAEEEELLTCMHSMVFIDLYVRSYFRREIVCSIAEAGIPITVIGKDWEKSGCKKFENLHCLGQMDSAACLRYMQQSRIALNIMPWFKKGAHDRIFNAMLQRCAVVTDSSGYLDQILVPQHNAVVFSLEQREELPQQIEALLQQPSALREMAEAGYRTAKESHTWAHRALKILGSE